MLMRILLLAALMLLVVSSQAEAYTGPGGGLTAIGALLAVVLAALAVLFGFIWYPLKRLLRRRKAPPSGDRDTGE